MDQTDDPMQPVATEATAETEKEPKKIFKAPIFPEYSADPNEWRIRPRERKTVQFNPKRLPGNTDLISETDPIGIVFLTMLGEPLDLMITEINRYGNSRKLSKKWKDIDRGELCTYLGLLFAMGALPKQNYLDYWRDEGITSTPNFKKEMSLARFKQISENLHFQDEEEAVRNGWDVRGGPNRDVLYKIRKFWELCFKGFRSVRAPYRRVSVDEQIIPFLGQFSYKQYIPGKPRSTGVKTYAICESGTGYTLAGHIHSADQFPMHDEGVIMSRVMALMEEGDLLDQGFELFSDNYYSSKVLVDKLLGRNTYFCGTLKSLMTTGLPESVADRNSPYSKTLLRGQAVFIHTDKISICNWKDRENVVFLYSLPDVVEEFQNCKRWLVSKTNHPDHPDVYTQRKTMVPQPHIGHLYNSYMGGVDLADQLIANVIRYFRVKKWYKAVFNYLMMSACCNSFIIMKERILNSKLRSRYTVRQARIELAEELLKIGKTTSTIQVALVPFCDRHFPITVNKAGACKGCQMSKHRKRVKVMCETCRVFLCLKCFKAYHTVQ